MPTEREQDLRSRALTQFLEQRVAEGFRVETRTGTHAIIVSPRRFSDPRGFLRRLRDRREVVSVDEDGLVTTEAAEPIRW